MGSHVVSFRFSDREIELLRQQANSPDESPNAIAQRLLRESLGVSTSAFTNVDNLEARVQAIVDTRMEAIASDIVDRCIRERLQEEMATILGESVA
jgi:hypothetical protein